MTDLPRAKLGGRDGRKRHLDNDLRLNYAPSALGACHLGGKRWFAVVAVSRSLDL
jgi:hypothetical protein